MANSRNYFDKFPTITYNDYVIRDVSLRTKLTRYLLESGLALLPYTIKESERADQIASFYYDDPYYAWAIYLVNGIIDPYSEWPKTDIAFRSYIDEQFGSFENAVDEIVRYEVNWAEDTSVISPETYNALPIENKRYWSPQFGYNREIINYFRTEIDTVLNNNRVDQITVVAVNTSVTLDFLLGERLYQNAASGDLAVKSTIASVDEVIAANTINLTYTNSTSFEVKFYGNNTLLQVKSTQSILPRANVVGTGLLTGTYVKRIVDTTHVELSAAPTSNAVAGTYSIENPEFATITVHKVDFSETTFANGGGYAMPNAFFTYTTGAYYDLGNRLVGRKSGAEAIVLTHERLDKNPRALPLLCNSHLTDSELVYWKSVNAYEDEQNKNEQRKEIFVLDADVIDQLDEALEKLMKNG